jgi:hypothetical protein
MSTEATEAVVVAGRGSRRAQAQRWRAANRSRRDKRAIEGVGGRGGRSALSRTRMRRGILKGGVTNSGWIPALRGGFVGASVLTKFLAHLLCLPR